MSDIRDTAAQALRAAAGDEAEVIVLAERSGLARFAASEVHQPTLIENVVVNLLFARYGRLGMASTNRVDDDALRELAGRLKKRCGVGGSAKNGVIELQGDHRDVVVEVLRASGYDVVLAGG